MEYAIAGGVTALFILIYLLTRQKDRETFTEAYDEEKFAAEIKAFAENMPAPSDGGKGVPTVSMKRNIRRAVRRINPDDDEESFRRFAAAMKDKAQDIKEMTEKDYTAMQELPSIDGTPRVYLIADKIMSHSRYILCADRVETALTAINSARTLTFRETEALENAFYLVLYRKLSFLCARMCAVVKIRKKALKLAKHPERHKKSADFKMLKGNAVFSKFCAAELDYDTEKFDELYEKIIDDIMFYLGNVFDSMDNLRLMDFTEYYEPLKILAAYEVFAAADAECKREFLTALSELSAKENVDETAYAVRLANYGEASKIPPVRARRINFLSRRGVTAVFGANLLTLARALTSDTVMNMLFGKKSGKSIIKTVKIKNSYMPKIKNCTAEFGISVENGNLRISPRLSSDIVGAHVTLRHVGVLHSVTIERGDEELIVNGTRMRGVPAIALNEIPLNIVVKIPDSDKKRY